MAQQLNQAEKRSIPVNFQEENAEDQDIRARTILQFILAPQAESKVHGLDLSCPVDVQLCGPTDFAARLQQALYRADRTNHAFVLLLLRVTTNQRTTPSPYILHRICSCLRKSDSLLQYGKETFAVLLDSIADLDTIPLAVEKIIQTLNPGGARRSRFDVRAGASVFPEDGYLLETLWSAAQSALQQTSSRGMDKTRFANTRRNHHARERLEMCDALHRGLRNQEFETHYQPVIDAMSGRTHCVELLLRWRHPRRGLLPTERFLHLLEETGLIIPVGEWLIDMACQAGQALHVAGHRETRFSVNLSERQLQEPGFVDRLEWMLHDRGHAPDSLELECREAMLMRNLDASRETVRKLAELGVPVCVDRFSGNNHSLSELMRLPLAGLKIDRQLIRRLPFDHTYKAITGGILAFANSMGIRASACGVENLGQLKFLRERDCHLVQGNFIARPMTFAELEQWLPE